MFPFLQLGPLAIPVAGLVLLAGLWLGLEAAERTAPHYGVPRAQVYALTFVALVAGLAGARLGYVLRYLEGYLNDPRALLALNANTLDRTTGLAAALLAAFFYLRWRRLPRRRTLDSLAPGLALFAVTVGLAHLASGNAFGAPANLPWAIELWDARRHPSQVYEIAAALLVFLGVWRLRRANPFPGFLFACWLALTTGSRLFLETFRGDSVIVADSLRQAQLVALLLLLFSLWLMGAWARIVEPTSEPTGNSPRTQ